MAMTPQRLDRIREVSNSRQTDLTVVLENVHDPHNISAVMRTCDSIGVGEIHVIYTEERLGEDNIKLGKRSSAGTRKWVDVKLYRTIEDCLSVLKPAHRFLGAFMDENAPTLFDLDLTIPTALVFGNEKDGLSDEMLKHLDGKFFIPQVGMVKSLNISVACAVSLYEAYRQRTLSGNYADSTEVKNQSLFDEYVSRSTDKLYGTDSIEF